MRLKRVERGHGLKGKALLLAVRLMSGEPARDVVRALLYRPRLFGDPFRAYLQEVMRGPSEWSVGERELMAAFVSQKNRCRY